MNSEKMKGEILTDKNEAWNVTRLELNKEEIDVNSLVKELTRQKDAASDLRRQLNELRKRIEDVKVNSTIAENELRKQLANRSTQVRVSDILFYYMTGSVGAGIRRIKSRAVIVYPSGQDTSISPASSGLPGHPRTMQPTKQLFKRALFQYNFV